ncbi:SMU1112c/YaeR family gloxylase I-like metalloprotein [Ancylobacter pratisalsi]|uniref:VOC family protein n=1 Tax=Ancylobacter pratisalsi TaxID=1745854 RepID=A0A6P1YQT4_9HYPH|nr:VOC family protein [Ancylobacter pratisalsi]QIB35250.1 VOC family protein [Ancylobacter pratisalsi]
MRGVHHIAIICSDYDRSRHFYVEVLGLGVLHEAYRAERQSWKCDLDAGNARIELFSFPTPPPRPSRPEACGLRHLAFATEDIEADIGRLTSLGIAVDELRTDPFTGRRFTFFADPDGLPLELYEHSEGA